MVLVFLIHLDNQDVTMKLYRRIHFQRIALLFLFFNGLVPSLKSQYFSLGTDPGSIHWKQIKTSHFRIIFPRGFEQQSQYVANGFEYVYQPASRTLHSHPPLTFVILHNLSTAPNAFAPYAPRRLEFLTVSPQDTYAQEWLDQLIIHEYRHASQYAAINQGFTRGLYYLLGEQAVPAVLGLFVPFWFIEGDATVIETSLYHSGRGRIPAFEMRLRAQFLQKRIYSYEKAVDGSYKDLVPDRYELGYQLVGMTRTNYGATVWSGVLKKVGYCPFLLAPFSSSLRQQTGLGKYGLYRSLTSQMQKNWRALDEMIIPSLYHQISKPAGKFYTSYNLPVIFRDSLIIAEKSSIDDITRIVIIDRYGTEKQLFTAGIGDVSESLSVSDSVLCWSEVTDDPRWHLRDYRVIKTYQFSSGAITQLTHLSRYFAPAISLDGQRIVAVEVTPGNLYSLVILNATDGRVIKKITTPENLFFIHPRWSDDGLSIVTVVLGKEGNSIAEVDPIKGTLDVLLPYSYLEIKRPSFYRDYILYNASYTGVDNIFALWRKTGEIFQVTSARFGASDASVNAVRPEMVYSNYTADGYEVVSTKLDPSTWKPFIFISSTPFPLADQLAQQEHFIFNHDSVPQQEYPVKPYRKGGHLFDFHSWAPFSFDAGNLSLSTGAMLLSQNLLSSSFTTLGYAYNLNEETGKYYLSYTYEGLYPALDLNADFGLRRGTYIDKNNTEIPLKWNELNVTAAFRLPLKWSHNVWFRGVQPMAGSTYKLMKMDPSVPTLFSEDHIIALNYSISAYNQMKSSLQDIYPRWAQVVTFNFSNTPFGKKYNSILASEVFLYLPGFIRHHGLRVYAGYQRQAVDDYRFSDFINYPRGYSGIYSDEAVSFSATYAFPLFYPDWRLGPVIYIKRFKGAVFYDHALGIDRSPIIDYTSAGLDLTMDFHVLSFFIPIEAGLRSVYKTGDNTFVFQFLINVNINSLY
jgi:hypothetical protein